MKRFLGVDECNQFVEVSLTQSPSVTDLRVLDRPKATGCCSDLSLILSLQAPGCELHSSREVRMEIEMKKKKTTIQLCATAE